jgi:hypothetical protein
MAHRVFNPEKAPEEALKFGFYEQLQYSDYPIVHYVSSDRASSIINCSKTQEQCGTG